MNNAATVDNFIKPIIKRNHKPLVPIRCYKTSNHNLRTFVTSPTQYPLCHSLRKNGKYAKMGSIGLETVLVGGEFTAGKAVTQKLRFLCLHGFRTSGDIMKKQVVGKWPSQVTTRLDMFFADAPFPAEGKSDVEGIFPPPYYEWFQFSKDYMEYRNLDECLDYIEDLMIKHGPFDGLMGFSQGAILSAALPNLQSRGLALTKVPKIKCVVIISGARFRKSDVAEKAYGTKIKCPSLHFLGEDDFLKFHGEKLLESFVEPFVIRHPKGHTVPRLVNEESIRTINAFLSKIESEAKRSCSV